MLASWWLLSAALVGCGGPGPADLVVVGDAIVEIGGGKVVAIRDPTSDAPLAIDANTAVLRADRVTAGFVDAHGHLDGLGNELAELDLTSATSYADTLERIGAATVSGDWLVGRGWDQNRWSDAPEGGWPLAADLQRVQPGKRIVLKRVDGHAAWVSLTALTEADLAAATKDPPGGKLVRDPLGNPTGVLVDRAMELVKAPEPTLGERRQRLMSALVLVAAKGLTGVHMMGADDVVVKILRDLAESNQLPVRVWLYVDPDGQAAKDLLASGPTSVGRLKVVGIKLYADGALGSRGALLSAPYTDAPSEVGTEVTPAAELERVATEALGAGVQVAIHAIGDAAVTRALDAFAAARRAHPDRAGIPLRVEHAQVVRPEDRARFAALGVVASMQPTHAVSDRAWAEARLGPERIGWAYPWESLRKAGALLAFGSDFPVEAVDPGLGIAAAVERGGWTPAESVSLEDAIAAFTLGAAKAVGETELGTLAAGKPADLTLWQIADDGGWRAVGTIVGGELVAGAPLPKAPVPPQ